MKKTDGFTLVELMVGILATTLVSGAIMTFLLMGLKANRATIDANEDQRNAKIMITMMEKLTSEGTITGVEYIEEGDNCDWSLLADETIVLSYSGSSQSLRGRNGSSLMDGVLASNVKINTETLPGTGCILEFTLETSSGKYETSVFCRSVKIDSDDLERSDIVPKSESDLPSGTDAATARVALISTLVSQLGSTGKIIDTDTPYSLWYCGGTSYLPGWNENTPWCACFVSWGIDAVKNQLNSVPCEANVDELWLEFENTQTINPHLAVGNVLPGDLIFFDWDNNSTNENLSLEHVGVVLFIEDGHVYTIEGNSGGIVALRRYSVKDPAIHGYGILDWNTNT